MLDDTKSSPNTKNEEEAENKELQNSFKRFLVSLRHYLNIKEGVDIENTITSIKKDVEFKGYNIYILIFSIFIASIGLNVNSTAVVIGAMLISPLMGPIVSMGLAIGTSDIKLLNKSLKNIGLMVLFSITTAWLYFTITPIMEVSHELLARTKPTLLDAFVAIFGGLAGIMASSRKEKSNVVPGVAIATALMPPLCTAGYGLAIGNFEYFFGALYLFVLNSIFISLTAVVVVRYVGFPEVDFIDATRKKHVKSSIYTFVVIVLLPSGFIFWNVIQESVFRQRANTFITKHIEAENIAVINSRLNFSTDGSVIELFLMGDRLTESDKKTLVEKLALEGLENTTLRIRQDKDLASDIERDITGKLKTELRSGIIEEMFTENKKQLENSNRRNQLLLEQIEALHGDSVPSYVLRHEVKVQYPQIVSTYFATIEHQLDSAHSDTIPTVFVHWDKKMRNGNKKKQEAKLAAWLKIRLKMDTVRVVEY